MNNKKEKWSRLPDFQMKASPIVPLHLLDKLGYQMPVSNLSMNPRVQILEID
ncbi:MAG: hypothetical protein JSW00_10465 [Thermoplasmata archaeon]|nr:MAG: hypothetical protein JSW00_10465 [Thermoplasmata archaeon]